MKNGQMQAQLFIYIMTIIVVGALLFFGVSWIVDLYKYQQTIDEQTFIKDLTTAFDSIRTRYGSSESYTFKAPADADMVCFVDTSVPVQMGYDVCRSTHDDYDPFICNAWNDKVSGILISPQMKSGDIDIGDVVIDQTDTPQRHFCWHTDRNKQIKVKLVGLGDGVKVIKLINT